MPTSPKNLRNGTRRRRLLAAAAGVLGLVMVAAILAAGRDQASPTADESSASATATNGGAGLGSALPLIEATALDGQAVKLTPGKPTAVFFFAGWCGTCIPEATALGRLKQEMGDKVTVVAVDVDPSDDAKTIDAFLAAAGRPTYPVVHDKTGALTQAYDVKALDVTVIADAAGTVVYRDAVPTGEDQLRTALAKAGAA